MKYVRKTIGLKMDIDLNIVLEQLEDYADVLENAIFEEDENERKRLLKSLSKELIDMGERLNQCTK